VTTFDSKEVAKLLASKLIERRDAKAVQTPSGAYIPDRTENDELIPWSLADVIAHVEGKRTLGHYLVSSEGSCRALAFDIDLRKKANPDRNEEPILFDGEEIDPREVWAGPASPAKRDLALQLRYMADGLAKRTKKVLDVQVLVSYSGAKGMHVYGLLDPGTPASDARDAAKLVIDSLEVIVPEHGNNFFRHESEYKALSIEVFPKQDEIRPGGFGNLLRLPLGVNRKTGKPGFFMNPMAPDGKFEIDDPIAALTHGSLR
jgi:hypothetical protein